MALFFFLIGPAGSGKSTIGKKIKKELKFKFFEGDTFHSKNNINKMKNGIKLKYKDRYVEDFIRPLIDEHNPQLWFDYYFEAEREASCLCFEGTTEEEYEDEIYDRIKLIRGSWTLRQYTAKVSTICWKIVSNNTLEIGTGLIFIEKKSLKKKR